LILAHQKERASTGKLRIEQRAAQLIKTVRRMKGQAIRIVGKGRSIDYPHIRWVRFDPDGQAWCDKMDCWDCYCLMKIGKALDYREVVSCSYTIVAGKAAWSAFALSQGSFVILTMTQQAIRLCKSLEIEVPDLSDEVPRLVAAC
jgi:hypothetical protein